MCVYTDRLLNLNLKVLLLIIYNFIFYHLYKCRIFIKFKKFLNSGYVSLTLQLNFLYYYIINIIKMRLKHIIVFQTFNFYS